MIWEREKKKDNKLLKVITKVITGIIVGEVEGCYAILQLAAQTSLNPNTESFSHLTWNKQNAVKQKEKLWNKSFEIQLI